MRTALLLGVLLVLTDHTTAQSPQAAAAPQRFGTRYLTGRVGLQPFDSGLTIAEDRVIITTSKQKNDVYVEAFSIPLNMITSATVRQPRGEDEYVTIATEAPTGVEALVFQVTPREGAGIVAKINFAITRLTLRTDPATRPVGDGSRSSERGSPSLFAQPARVPAGAVLYVEPTEFGQAMAAAIMKKKVPVIITTDREKASYFLVAAAAAKTEGQGERIAKVVMLGAFAGSGKSFDASVSVADTDGVVRFAYSSKKSNFQSAAEGVAKNLKNHIDGK